MRFVSKILGVILSILFFVTMYMVYQLNILPIKYFFIVGLFLLLIVFCLVFKLIRKKTSIFSRIFFMAISIVFIICNYFILTYINATYDFMNSMVFNKFETITYRVIVNSNTNYKKINDLNNLEIGYLKSDNNYKKLKLLMMKDIKYKESKYKNINSLLSDVKNQQIPGIVLEDSYYELLKEEYTDLEASTKIIKSYKLIVPKEKKASSSSTRNPFIIYISGIDTYGKISSVSRSDVNIVAVVNPMTEKILLVSIPRDYYVQLHGTSGNKDKLTHAGIYGIDMSVNTIKDLLDIDIDYYLRLNFSTLTKSIDLLDGIDVYSDRTFHPYTNSSITITEGINHMNGEEALAFARERHAYATGDRHRGENQQAIITAVIKKMSSPTMITKYKNLLESLEGTFETSMSYEDISNLVKLQLDKEIDWNIESISLDGTGKMLPTYSMGNRNLYVMIPNEDTIKAAKKKISQTLNEDK